MDADRRQHEETYRGCKLCVYAQREGTRWVWWYSLDGGDGGRCAPRAMLADADAALRRGINAARARADELSVASSASKARHLAKKKAK